MVFAVSCGLSFHIFLLDLLSIYLVFLLFSRQRNTYQLALVTDEQETFAVFNYYNVTWVGGTRQGCDPNTGKMSQTNLDCHPAQVYNGFSKLHRFSISGGALVEIRHVFPDWFNCWQVDLYINPGKARSFQRLPYILGTNPFAAPHYTRPNLNPPM